MKFFDHALQARVVRHEEKEENLVRFIGYFLDRLSIRETPDETERSVNLIARSPLSPSARAVLACAREFASLDAQLRVVFCKPEPVEAIADWIDIAVADGASAPRLELRWARNPALLDAHEQLVLGSQLSWSGDCMRREPEKRDAYELFATFHAEATHRASQGFRSLWELAQPIALARPRPQAVKAPAVPVVPMPALTENPTEESRPIVSTRH